jgi:hypothetical protein
MSTTNPTWTDLGLNPDLHDERPSTKQWHVQHMALTAMVWFGGHIFCCTVMDMNRIPHFKISVHQIRISTVSNQ